MIDGRREDDLGAGGTQLLELQDQGAANINLVTPTPYVPQIAEALTSAKRQGLALPVVYNCGGYEKVSTLQRLEALVDIWPTKKVSAKL